MHWWKRFLASLGLTDDARIHVEAAGIDVVITGKAELVRAVLEAVRAEIEHQQRGGGPRQESRARGLPPGRGKAADSQVVLPTELDEMDSPYALPGHAGKKGELVRTKVTEEPRVGGSAAERTAEEPAYREDGEPPEPTTIESSPTPAPEPLASFDSVRTERGPESTDSSRTKDARRSGGGS